MSDQVTNPRHTYLTQLLQQVGLIQDEIGGNLYSGAYESADLDELGVAGGSVAGRFPIPVGRRHGQGGPGGYWLTARL